VTSAEWGNGLIIYSAKDLTDTIVFSRAELGREYVGPAVLANVDWRAIGRERRDAGTGRRRVRRRAGSERNTAVVRKRRIL
jgi:hypothetical protein